MRARSARTIRVKAVAIRVAGGIGRAIVAVSSNAGLAYRAVYAVAAVRVLNRASGAVRAIRAVRVAGAPYDADVVLCARVAPAASAVRVSARRAERVAETILIALGAVARKAERTLGTGNVGRARAVRIKAVADRVAVSVLGAVAAQSVYAGFALRAIHALAAVRIAYRASGALRAIRAVWVVGTTDYADAVLPAAFISACPPRNAWQASSMKARFSS